MCVCSFPLTSYNGDPWRLDASEAASASAVATSTARGEEEATRGAPLHNKYQHVPLVLSRIVIKLEQQNWQQPQHQHQEGTADTFHLGLEMPCQDRLSKLHSVSLPLRLYRLPNSMHKGTTGKRVVPSGIMWQSGFL